MWKTKSNYDASIQLENFLRIFLFKNRNNTLDISNCMIRTTFQHHLWPTRLGNVTPNMPNYSLQSYQLIDLPKGVFGMLTSNVFEILKGVTSAGRPRDGFKNIIPLKFRTSYYGYK